MDIKQEAHHSDATLERPQAMNMLAPIVQVQLSMSRVSAKYARNRTI